MRPRSIGASSSLASGSIARTVLLEGGEVGGLDIEEVIGGRVDLDIAGDLGEQRAVDQRHGDEEPEAEAERDGDGAGERTRPGDAGERERKRRRLARAGSARRSAATSRPKPVSSRKAATMPAEIEAVMARSSDAAMASANSASPADRRAHRVGPGRALRAPR